MAENRKTHLDVADLTRDKTYFQGYSLLDKGLGPGQAWVNRQPDKFNCYWETETRANSKWGRGVLESLIQSKMK